MKKSLCLIIIIIALTAVTAQATILWNFDTLSPATIHQNGYIYVNQYTSYINTKGIGGTNALQVGIPYQTGVAPHRKGGGGFWLSNYPGWNMDTLSPYNGTQNNTANNINLSSDSIVYFSVIANNTTPFGVCFGVYDTSGQEFISSGKTYLGDTVALQGSISTTAFKKTLWNVASMHVYSPGHNTGRAPALANIEALQWFFLVNPKGSPSGQNGLYLYFDNVGAAPNPSTPVELWNLEATARGKK